MVYDKHTYAVSNGIVFGCFKYYVKRHGNWKSSLLAWNFSLATRTFYITKVEFHVKQFLNLNMNKWHTCIKGFNLKSTENYVVNREKAKQKCNIVCLVSNIMTTKYYIVIYTCASVVNYFIISLFLCLGFLIVARVNVDVL